MTDISGNGIITIDGVPFEGVVFYWLTVAEKPGSMAAEGSISGPEDILRKVKKAKRVTLALEDGPPLAVKCEGGRNVSVGLEQRATRPALRRSGFTVPIWSDQGTFTNLPTAPRWLPKWDGPFFRMMLTSLRKRV
jgi:hypothetical protein